VTIPTGADVAELVRLPAVLSVPGDVLVGAAASGQVGRAGRTAGLVASSSCLYLAGMALNDYADREVDAVERPGRPIPSGRVSPAFALGLAGALTAAGAGLAVAADGRRALGVVAPLAAAIWGYDLVLKSGPAGVATMAACRGLDVMMGSGASGAARALPAAAVVTAHIGVVTTVSRQEMTGGDATVAKRALAATAALAGAAALVGARAGASPSGRRRRAPLARFAGRGRPPALSPARLAGLGLVGAYAATVGRAHADAIRDPSPARLQKAVGTGIMGLMPLEAGLLAGAGSLVPAAGVAALWPLARAAAKRRAVT
jgi:UbiA prenyltransferase family